MKKIISFVIASCVALSLAACGGVNLDRTVFLSNGFTFKVSSSWEEETFEDIEDGYRFVTDAGNFLVFTLNNKDPYEIQRINLNGMRESAYFSNITEMPAKESTIDRAFQVVFEITYTHSNFGDYRAISVYTVRDNTTVILSYSAPIDEFNRSYFDSVRKSILWP